MSDNFDGGGFSEKVLQGEEAARHRHMFNALDKNWVLIEGIVSGFRGIRVLVVTIKFATPLGILAGLAVIGGWVLKMRGLI